MLALDTAMAACSAAVLVDGSVVARRRERRERGHAEALMPMVAAAMAEAGLDYAALDAIAVTRGPGTFTGVRIGLAAARGLALASATPLIGLTTLEVLAAEACADGWPEQWLNTSGLDWSPIFQILAARVGREPTTLAAIEARRGEVYAQRFPNGPPAAAMRVEAAAALGGRGPVRVVGDAAARIAALIGARATVAPGDGQPDAAVAAWLAQHRRPGGAAPAPLYLRAPDARLPMAR